MEFLSREFDRDKQIYPVNLVIQSRESAKAGYDARATGTFSPVNLTFDPTEGFHEYRFDYMPGRVLFYADSELLAEMKGHSVPSASGHIILQHWSNGNPQWSGGPPERDTVFTVSYVKAYFNSSDARRQLEWSKRCDGSNGSDVCAVPDMTAAEASTGGKFLGDGGQPAKNETKQWADDESSRACALHLHSWRTILVVTMATLITATPLMTESAMVTF